MSQGASRLDPVSIGEVADPSFGRLPDPLTLFASRAERLRALAEGNALGPYLGFLGALSDIQDRVQRGLPEPDMPAADDVARAREFAMPPLDRNKFKADAAFDATLERLFAQAAEIDMPAPAREALARARNASDVDRGDMVRAVLADAVPVETVADHVFVAAALQVHFARSAARLDGKALVPVADGICPCCGGPPVSSMVVGWQGALNTRYCFCSLCATAWHVVRIKCVVCASTKGIAYREVEGTDPNVKAETCESCRTYVKVMQQQKDPRLDPVADDVASLALDLLVRDEGYRRGAVNPFLIGY
jgi:FdhE protein